MVRSPSATSDEASIPATLYVVPTIPQVLDGQTILITGGAGFVGTALLYRLVASDIKPKRVYTVIRGGNPISRLPVDLHPFVATRLDDGSFSDAPIVILAGDCFLPDFGLTGRDARCLKEVEIVIHTAGDTRFTLPLSQAMHAIADLGVAMCQFTIASLRVRTHIHLSTTFTGWYQENGAVVLEELVPELDQSVQAQDHANTYLHAKSITEGLVNAIARPQAGRPKSKINWRVVRLATVGPAVAFPYPGYGAGSPSSPVCSAIAAEVVTSANYCLNSELDGMDPRAPIPMALLDSLDCKLAEPYVPAKNLLRAYSPMICKVVKFDNSRTLALLGLAPVSKAPRYNVDPFYGLTVPVSDGCIDTTGFEVDLQKSVDAVGGWKVYLQTVRDRMEVMAEPASADAHVD
ncbi:hypothetical protein RQP46_001005 [Phenoliferia psychrophenolica]